MAKYAFFCFPAHGHVNPTLAIVQELVARGEQVTYYLTEEFRPSIEATGATFHPYRNEAFKNMRPPAAGPVDLTKRLAMLPMHMVMKSQELLPELLESVRAEQVDCIVYDAMFLWARLVAQILHIPAVMLRPTYAPNEHIPLFARLRERFTMAPEQLAPLNQQLAQISSAYDLPPLDMRSIFTYVENLNIVFIPRAFHPGGDTFDERFVFVGPSLQTQRYSANSFPFERLDGRPLLYISLGTVFNNRADFFNQCFHAFGQSAWQVVLSIGKMVDRGMLDTIPENFIVESHVPQLALLPRSTVFISHGGMNSTMESLYHGVPLVVIPQMLEQEMTAQRVQELGLGLALDNNCITTEQLRDAVERVAHEPTFRTNVQTMRQAIAESGGHQRATDAIMDYTHASLREHALQ